MIITTTDIQLFKILKQKLGEAEAEALVSFVDAKLKENNEVNLKILATKEDTSNIKEDIAKLEGKLETKIAETKADMIKWMFSFFVAMMLAIIGLYFKH
ncbi:MAG: hypothetical protein WBP45_11945 [Daejeonella sp.]